MMTPELNRIHQGGALETLRTWPSVFVHTCVTSPPYWGLRDYGVDGQLGLEKTPQEYVEKMVGVFREVRRVLRDDGTLWLNLGDSYYNQRGANNRRSDLDLARRDTLQKDHHNISARPNEMHIDGLKGKDLIGIPWRVAFALQADGWYLRQDIIWAKPNPMPESVTDRCTKAHEYIFLLAKSERYYYDWESVLEPVSEVSLARVAQNEGHPKWNGNRDRSSTQSPQTLDINKLVDPAGRNKRSVWTITTKSFADAHFATFPEDLISPCILAGSPQGGVVLDPFMGAGTTALVAARYSRDFIGCELNPEYIRMAEKRIASEKAQGKLF